MFIINTKRLGKRYLQLAQSSNCKTQIVKNIGYLDKFTDGSKDYLERLKLSVKNGHPLIKELEPLVNKHNRQIYISTKENDYTYLNSKNIGYFLLDAIYEKLGIIDVISKHKSINKIKYDLNGITKLLTFGRVLNPKSKISTIEQNNNYLFKPAKIENKKNVYDCLDELNKISDKIQHRIHTKISNAKTISRNKDLIYYDVTNYYFESENIGEDELDEYGNLIREDLKKRGISKEKKSKNPIVQMGLFLDTNNIPINYKLFPGNHIDQTTLRPALKNSIYNWDFNKVIIVADRGLSSDKNILDIVKNKNGYVISKSIKRSKQEFIDWVIDKKGYKDLDNKTPIKDSKFYIKSRIVNRIAIDKDGKKYQIKEKQVVYWSKAHYLKELKDNKKFQDYLKLIENNPNKLRDKQKLIEKYLTKTIVDKKTGKKLKNSKIDIEVNYKKLQRDVSLLGYYCICSSETEKKDTEIISIYKNLTKIENEFRIIKSNLNGRPIYVRTNEHINAHFLICFISLVLINIIQLKIRNYKNKALKQNKWYMGLTAETIINELNNFNADSLNDKFYKTSKPSKITKLILKALNSGFDLMLPNYTELTKFQQNLKKNIVL
jgi:transposase